MKMRFSRRQFLRGVSALSVAAVCGNRAQALLPRVRPSNTLSLGVIGAGGMGRTHVERLVQRPGIRLAAVADPDAHRRIAAREFAETRGHRMAAYADYRDMLREHPELDAVIIAAPDHWHAQMALDALAAGMDVYGETPLAYSIEEGRAVVNAVHRYGRVFQLGIAQRSQAHFVHVCNLIRQGRIGTVEKAVCFFGPNPCAAPAPDEAAPAFLDWRLYLGPARARAYNPLIHPCNFRYFRDFSGGAITDWGVHLLDMAQWALDKDRISPKCVEAEGGYYPGNFYDVPRWMRVQYDYGDVCVEWHQGTDTVFEAGQKYGTKFYGSEGEIFVNRSGYCARRKDGRAVDEHLSAHETPAHHIGDHYTNFFQAMHTRQAPVCDVETGHHSTALAHLGNMAVAQRVRRAPSAGDCAW